MNVHVNMMMYIAINRAYLFGYLSMAIASLYYVDKPDKFHIPQSSGGIHPLILKYTILSKRGMQVIALVYSKMLLTDHMYL